MWEVKKLTVFWRSNGVLRFVLGMREARSEDAELSHIRVPRYLLNVNRNM